MQSPITITVTGEQKGDAFVAVSPQFPGVEWEGSTDEEAFESFWNDAYAVTRLWEPVGLPRH